MPTNLPPAILETILVRLAILFLNGTAGDTTAARNAAAQMLAAYNPRTEEELTLAATIISFSFQSFEALAQASDPNIPLPLILRLRGGAVSLSREADKARRRLAAIQKAKPEPAPIKAPAPQQPTRSKSEACRQTDFRIAASLQRTEAKLAPTPAHNVPNNGHSDAMAHAARAQVNGTPT